MKLPKKFSPSSALLLDGALLALVPVMKLMSFVMIAGLPDTCVLYRLGFLCPACGGTRCVRSLASGDFAAAYGYNKFIFCAVVYFLIALFLYNLFCFFKWSFAEKAIRVLLGKTALITIAFLYIIFGIIRNVI